MEAAASPSRRTPCRPSARLLVGGPAPTRVAACKPPAMKRILGALLHRERIALVDLSQAEPRARLTEAHEIGHGIIPWHEAAFQLDDKERLLGATRDQLEQEAYLAGGHLIFQGLHFWKRALDYRVSIATPVALAAEYRASMHATIRYYALEHPDLGLRPGGGPVPEVQRQRSGVREH